MLLRMKGAVKFKSMDKNELHSNWSSFKKAFEWDGSLRDVYIRETTDADWQKFLDFLREKHYPISLSLGNEVLLLPDNVNSIFDLQLHPLLSIAVDGLTVSSHKCC